MLSKSRTYPLAFCGLAEGAADKRRTRDRKYLVTYEKSKDVHQYVRVKNRYSIIFYDLHDTKMLALENLASAVNFMV